MTPLDYYQAEVAKETITSDSEQLRALQFLQKMQADLLQEAARRKKLLAFLQKPKIVKGVYLWGGVGIGKTFLMDCFYHTLPFSNKMRMHFHRFMQMVHEKLTNHQGEENPLEAIAAELSKQTMVFCFDELFVSDITDAMLLGRLFQTLFAHGVSLVATSNVAPDDLYKNGLQRARFLPAIALLKTEMSIVNLPSTIDYRLRHLKQAGVFYTPLNRNTAIQMEKTFVALTAGKTIVYEPILINDRLININKQTDNVVWFEFNEICHVPRSQLDYLTLSEKYHTIFISDIPVISEDEKDTISLFINLVDVMYDAHVRLVISAAEPVEELYARGYMIMEYARTHSRLLEMQSENYFGRDD